MKATFSRGIDPLALVFRIEYSEEDLDAAFTDQSDPNEELYYAIFSDAFKAASASEQLAHLLKVAQLVESPPANNITSAPSVVTR